MDIVYTFLGVVTGCVLAEVLMRLIGPGKALLVFIALLVGLFLLPDTSEAAGYRGSSSRGYSAPRAAPRPAPTVTRNTTVNKTTVNRTTVIQQRAPSSSSSSGAGSSFLGGMAGAVTGSAIGSWLFAPKPQEQPPQEAPVAPVQPQCDATLYDCTPKAQQ